MDNTIYQNQNPIGGMSDNIFAQIRKEQWDFMFNWISIVPGYPFNQYETIKRVHLYLNSRYMGGQEQTPTTITQSDLYQTTDNTGRLFFNIVIPPCEVGTKMLNIDTKNIRLWPLNPKSEFSSYLLEKELRQWLKGHKFGLALNKLAEEAPRYGSVVLEKIDSGANVVDLRRLILDPTVEKIQDSRFVTTISYMTPTQLRATNWDQDMVELAIKRYENFNTEEPYEDQFVNVNLMRSTPYIKVFKRYGEVPAHWIDTKLKPGTKAGDKMTRALFIVAGADWLMKNNDGKPVSDLGVILFSSPWRKEWPFKDFHYFKTRGRWLGVGIVEMLFDVQERFNELKNQKRTSMEVSTLHLFQGPKGMVRNVLTDLRNGDYLIKDNNSDGVMPVQNEERNLAAFKDEEESYSSQVDRLSFAYEAIRGDTQDASQATLGQTQIAVAQGTSVFAFKKENLSLFLQDFFNDLVLPELMHDLTPEHIMRFTGTTQEVLKLDQAAAEVHANTFVKEELFSGRMTTKDDFEAAKQKAMETYQKLGGNRFLKIKEAFYDDAEFEFDFLVTNEQADPAKMATNIQTILAEMPNLNLNDPRQQLLFSKLCENIGISPAEIELADQQAQLQQQQMQQQAQQNPQLAQQTQPPQKNGSMQLPATKQPTV
jgi:hypothetical protein